MGAEGLRHSLRPSLAASHEPAPCDRAAEMGSPAARESGFDFPGGSAGGTTKEQVWSPPCLLYSHEEYGPFAPQAHGRSQQGPDSDFAKVF